MSVNDSNDGFSAANLSDPSAFNAQLFKLTNKDLSPFAESLFSKEYKMKAMDIKKAVKEKQLEKKVQVTSYKSQ